MRAWTWMLAAVVVAMILIGLFMPISAAESQSYDGTPAKIFLTNDKGEKAGHGSAIFIGEDADGNFRWLTAKHVADNHLGSLRTRRVAFFDVEQEWLCPRCDLAVVRTPPQKVAKFIAAPISCRPLRVGEEVHYTGSPFNGGNLPRLTIWGRVSSSEPAKQPDGSAIYAVDITTDHGASGSGVLDSVGRVIGVLSAADFAWTGPFSPGVHSGLTWVASLAPEFCNYERQRAGKKPGDV